MFGPSGGAVNLFEPRALSGYRGPLHPVARGTGTRERPAMRLDVVVLALVVLSRAFPQETPASIQASSLVGTIALIGAAERVAQQAETVVWIPGLGGAGGTVPAQLTMESREKRFAPHVVAVPRGGMVAFPNADPIYHNVFSMSPGNAFDLGLYRKGAARSVLFRKAGLVRVYCNIHPEMTGYVMVIDGSAFAVTGRDGGYRIASIPPGRHTVRAWNEVGGEISAVLDFAPGRATTWDLSLDGSNYRPLPHKNKRGQDYPPATQDVDRY